MATFKKYTKGDGTYWQFRAYLGTDEATGKRISTTRRGFKTEREAKKAYKQLLIDYEKNGGLNSKPTINIKTFEELYNLWLESYQTTVKESTLNNTKHFFDKHILPSLGKYKFDKISIPQAQKAVNEWAKKVKSYGLFLSYCKSVINYGISLELIKVNPFNHVIKPKKKDTDVLKELEKSDENFFTKDELQKILNYLDEQTRLGNELQRHDNYLNYAIIRLLAFSGLRINEALALQWSDVSFTDYTISITKAMSRCKGGYKPSTPKTKASIRTISLDGKTMQILKAWRTTHKEMLFMNGKRSEYIFSSFEGVPRHIRTIEKLLDKTIEAVGVKRITLHGLRHTHASLLFASGVSIKEVQTRLGHSDIETTMNIYIHVTQEQQTETVEKLAKFANF